ncbi:alpha/beta fold hydrolase [Botryobacter ruber]|uniref:alpha/beta fold hydrolase n=1 Tax=Botryobacter ruber TaxID=2171629 RepID=UPI000E0B6D2C|nr:alpha/beta fold hydrolase [Botryobacter ruber]
MLHPRLTRNAFLYLSSCLLLLGCSPQRGVTDRGTVTQVVEQTLQQPYDFSPVTRKVQGWVDNGYYTGASLIVVKDDQVVYENYFGNYTPETVVYIASAGKWLAAATIAAVVDEGKLSWEDKVEKWLPEFKDQKGQATLRQLLSHTAGYPDYQPKGNQPDNYQTLKESVAHIVSLPADTLPGTRFKYGGLAMQVAGRMAELATGQDWESIFQEKMARPLNMPHTHFTPVDPTPGHNPMLGGGARSDIKGYLNFLSMLTHDGEFQGKRILSKKAIQELQADQVQNAKVAAGEYVANARATDRTDIYGLGNWREEVNAAGEPMLLSSPSWAGAYPWIDKKNNVYGFFLTRVASQKDGFSSFYASPVLPLLVRDVLQRAQDSSIVRSGWVSVGDAKLYYEEAGQGEPLILLHGHSLNRTMWDKQFFELAKNYRVIRYDMRGYGWSDDPVEDVPFTHAGDLTRLMQHHKIEKAHLVGLSLGSYVGTDMLALHPKKLLSLTAASGIYYHFTGSDQPITEAERQKRQEQIKAYKKNGIDVNKWEWFQALMRSGGSRKEEMRRPLWDMIYKWKAWQPLHIEPRLLLGNAVVPKLKQQQIKVPVLVLIGELDGGPGRSATSEAEAKDLFPNAKIILLKDAGHMSNMEAPEAFTKEVTSFLATVKKEI